jgi:hypothetical protein
MLVSASSHKFTTGPSPGSGLGNPARSGGSGNNVPAVSPLQPWECYKYSPVKMELPDTNLDDIVLDQSASTDFEQVSILQNFVSAKKISSQNIEQIFIKINDNNLGF